MLMKHNDKICRLLLILGLLCFFIGTIDPMEGSLIIAPGTIFIAANKYLMRNKLWRAYLFCSIAVILGVFALFYLSSLGGFGGYSQLSVWWGLTILPYPIGWIAIVVLMVVERRVKKKSKK
jgi:uncharacterized membrane protein YbhN (UPF0104 family)